MSITPAFLLLGVGPGRRQRSHGTSHQFSWKGTINTSLHWEPDKVWIVISAHLTVGCSLMNLSADENSKCCLRNWTNILSLSETAVFWWNHSFILPSQITNQKDERETFVKYTKQGRCVCQSLSQFRDVFYIYSKTMKKTVHRNQIQIMFWQEVRWIKCGEI